MRPSVACILTILGLSSSASAICRIVEEEGSPPPVVIPDQAVLISRRHDIVVGQDCDSDAGPNEPRDGGGAGDAGAGDAGAGDAGPGDAGAGDAGAGDAAPAACEQIRGDAITMVVQPRFVVGEDGARFALLMVTPARPVIWLEAKSLFKDLALATAPLAVAGDPEYIEDAALGYQCRDPKWNNSSGCTGISFGGSVDDDGVPGSSDPSFTPNDAVELQSIGAYEVARLSLPDVAALAQWLDQHDYVHTQADLDAAQPYVDAGWTVVAVRIATDEPLDGALEPLAMAWPGTEIRLPLGISRQPPPAGSWLTVYIDAAERTELEGAQIPYAQYTGFDRFLTRNSLWADLSRGAELDPIAHPVASVESRDTITVHDKIRIPSSECPGGRGGGSDGCLCSLRGGPSPGSALLAGIVAACMIRRRRRPGQSGRRAT